MSQQTVAGTVDLATFTRDAAALVAANDAAARHAELALAGDFNAWDDEFWSGYVSVPSESLIA